MRWAVLVGIVIILNVFFQVLRGIIFPAPQYNDFCSNALAAVSPAYPIPSGGTPAQQEAYQNLAQDKYQAAQEAAQQKCSDAFTAAQKSYQEKSFVLTVALGVLAFIVGVLPLGSSIVSTGLSYGGVLAFIIASLQYWNDAPQLIQLFISALALAILLYIGIKRFKD